MGTADRRLRVGLITDGIEERVHDGRATISNGGVGVYIAQLITALAERAECELVLIRNQEARLALFRDPRVRTVTLAGIPHGTVSRTLDRPYRRLADELHLDVLHYPNQFGGAFLPSRVCRVVTLHDITPLLFPDCHPWRRVLGYRLLLRRSLQAADHVIVDASHTKQDLVERGLAAADDVSVIPLGVGTAFAPTGQTDAVRRYGLPERYILNVGVLEPRKNHLGLLRAALRLHAHGEPITVVMVGRDGWHWQDPLETPELSSLRPWVRILRNVPEPDLVALYSGASVFAYPSLYEGFGLPVLEAMACGVPVVASNRSSLPEVAGDAALLVDPTNVEALADRLIAVIRDADLRQRLVAAGLARVRMFSWTQTAKRTLAIYQRVAQSARRDRR